MDKLLAFRFFCVRKKAGVSPRSLSIKSNVCYSAVKSIMQGLAIRESEYIALAKAMDVTPEFLKNGQGHIGLKYEDSQYRLINNLILECRDAEKSVIELAIDRAKEFKRLHANAFSFSPSPISLEDQ